MEFLQRNAGMMAYCRMKADGMRFLICDVKK